MGDRANVLVKMEQEDGTTGRLFLYTHWHGTALPEILRNALRRGKGRWGDPAYLTRIIFSEMVRGEEMLDTGFGIALYPPDNEHDYLVVDTVHEIVQRVCPDGTEVRGEWTFAEFVEVDLAQVFKDY